MSQLHILDTLFSVNKNIDKEKYKKFLKKIDENISVEKRRKNNQTINVSKSPGIDSYKKKMYLNIIQK